MTASENRNLKITGGTIFANAIIALTIIGCAKQQVCDEPLPIVHTAFHETAIETKPIHRVVVLPTENRSGVRAGVLETFQSGLAASIRECGRYEVVEIPAHLRPRCENEWIQRGVFPEELLADLYRNYSADGVIFVSVNGYRAYSPIAIAATVHVVDINEGVVLSSVEGNWSIDNPAVEQRMIAKMNEESNPHNTRVLMQSPRYLIDFVTNEIASELANRQ